MSTYTNDEIKAIVSAPMNVGMAIALVDMGIISTAIEAAAMTKAIAGAAKEYPNNSIIQAAFSEESLKQTKIDKPDVDPEGINSGAYIDQAIAEAQNVIAQLTDKAPESEVAEYKQFIYDCGETVAQAAGSGLFGTGAKVSEAEAATLTKLKTALAI
ncbi:MAG: hypothetical protein ACFBSG_20395 [Leptolyngbyaceae cyanobacterium]